MCRWHNSNWADFQQWLICLQSAGVKSCELSGQPVPQFWVKLIIGIRSYTEQGLYSSLHQQESGGACTNLQFFLRMLKKGWSSITETRDNVCIISGALQLCSVQTIVSVATSLEVIYSANCLRKCTSMPQPVWTSLIQQKLLMHINSKSYCKLALRL